MRNAALALALVLCLLAAAPLAATSFVLMPDEALVDSAPLVVAASVLSVEPAAVAGVPATDYLVEVERVVKGDVPGSHLIVRVPGGVGPGGVGLKLWGAPAFAPGEHVLLLLRPAADGAFRVVQLMMGAFHEVEAGGETLWVRALAEATELPMPGEAEGARAEYRLPRRSADFVDWIEQRALGAETAPDYFFQPPPGGPAPRALSGAFTVFCDDPTTQFPEPVGPEGECQPGAFPLRWFDFEAGITSRWRMHEDGQPGLSTAQATGALSEALAVWTDEPATDIRYALDTPLTTDSTNGLVEYDTLNVLLFDDPEGTIGQPFSCLSGGVLAVGGPWYTNAIDVHEGQQYLTIVNGDIVTNQGLQCFFDGASDPELLAAQLFAHELGHTLGFGHSCESPGECSGDAAADAALMRAFIHGESYGPTLRPDDIAAALHHYRAATGEPPAAPAGLAATPLSASSVLLDWQDQSSDESGFVVEAVSPVEEFHEIGEAGANATTFVADGLVAGRPYAFRVRAQNGGLVSPPSNEASATPQADPTAACNPGTETLCLLGGRFRVEADWHDQINGGNGVGKVQPSPTSGTKTGVFSFFNPNNIELIVKMLDATGTGGNGHFWLFYGALSTVEYWVTVTDTATGDSRTYRNPPGQLCGVPDTTAFPGASAPAGAPAGAPGLRGAPLTTLPAAGGVGSCVPNETTLCLAGGRFAVTVEWTDFAAESGSGVAVPGSEKTGYFWFFNSANIELVVKVLDASQVTGNWWVFYGALSNVEYTITVRDTVTGLERSYVNEAGDYCGAADTASFPDSP